MWEAAPLLLMPSGSQGPRPAQEAFLGLASWQRRFPGTGGAEEGGEGPWLINRHLGDSLGIFFRTLPGVEVGVF